MKLKTTKKEKTKVIPMADYRANSYNFYYNNNIIH